MVQKLFRLHVSRLPGETSNNFAFRQTDLAKKIKHPSVPVSAEKLFADLLKRHANSVCADLTQADAVQIPAHLARLKLVSELIRHAFTHGQVFGHEAVRSERKLCNPQTLADWQEVLSHTAKCHRAPAFLNNQESEFAEIKNQLNTIAGLLANHPAMAEFLTADESEVQA
jgi:hypothetical protein